MQNPFDPAQLQLMNSRIAPLWTADGQSPFLLGTDDQGRDILSTILYGTRISLVVGVARCCWPTRSASRSGWSPAMSAARVDAVIMRIADVQLTFPAILIALLVDGVARVAARQPRSTPRAFWLSVSAIGSAFWVQYARTVRGSMMVERNKEYVRAARLIGLPARRDHVPATCCPTCIGPVLVIATINLALAIITEATLSFLGVGLPPTSPRSAR